ncbi:fibronectin type III domain-containing protein [Aeromicrobium chenweiae]|uniref:Metallophosphoesterase n=1 Tax=Aeromicrobium chenweiae TaxID=2079793 RepID=A0A2S0WHQ4_9ACTN|nr:fibronectin type III domain-containing protein [Aeromicrobium chenweiae]AWB90814.1 metallophosphoesterase [Aeromicrobium chenweiae]TGN31077.1 metallophosphoesterase [Aeromicrobium chenweiae]
MKLKPRTTSLVLAPLLVGGLLATVGTGARAADPQPILTTGSTTWKYVQNDAHPSPGSLGWTTPTFDDSSWLSGKGGLGGKKDGTADSPVYDSSHTAATQLALDAPGSADRVRTYFLRTEFTLTADQLADIGELKGTVQADDGVIVYANGSEVARTDVPADTPEIGYANVDDTDLDTTSVSIPPDLLNVGENTIAVALHNQRASSSDVYFDFTDLTPVSAEDARPKPTRIILTPTETPETSQAFTWLAAIGADTTGKVQIRPTAGGATRTVKGYSQGTSPNNNFLHFSTTVTGLKQATSYDYRVASGSSWSDWKTFSTADPSDKDFEYVYYGDAQVGLDTTWPKVVNQALKKAPDAIGSVHAGDLIDSATNDTQWLNWFKGMETSAATKNVFAAPGNHEYTGDKLLTSWKAHFEYPLNQPSDSTIGDMAKLADGTTDVAKQYRAFFDHWAEFAAETVYFSDYQGVRFITINATRDTTFLTPDKLPACSGADCPSGKVAELWTQYQSEWLDHVLTDSPSKWNVVTFHQPVYSASEGRDEPILRKYWVPVFEKHNVDLVQMGHDHVYSRGFKNDDTTETPGVTDGPVYIVSNSGAKHYDLETDAKNVWTNNGATQVKKGEHFTTYQVISVSEDALHYTSYIAEKTDTATTDLKVGDVWDEFTVSKSDAGRKYVTEAGVPVPPLEDPAPEVPAPVITDQPGAKVKATVGDDVTLDVDVDSEADVTYQWQRRAATGGEWTDLKGQDEKSLTLEEVGAREARYVYRVQVTAGGQVVTSTPTALVVSKKATSVSIGATSFRKGSKGTVNVTASQSGMVRVTVKQGAVTRTAYASVRAGSSVKVKTGVLSKKGTRHLTVTATFTPNDSATYASSTVTKKVTAKKKKKK